MGKPLFTIQQFINAIPGTGGIITTIAQKVGCDWHTAKKYIEVHPTVKTAYDAEREKPLDLAESVLIKNIELALKKVMAGEMADTSDAKWILSRKGKDRGYVERQEVEQSGGLTIKVEYIDNDNAETA